MYTVKQYKRDMADLGGIFSQISNRLLEAAHLLTRMGAAVEASGSLDPTTPEPPDGVRKTDPAPAPKPCKDHHVGSCSCDGQETGPHFPAPAKPPAPPCRVLITAGAHVWKTGTVVAAKRGKRFRVRVDHEDKPPTEDDVYLDDVTLLEGSSPLPVYVPKAKTR